MGSFSEDFSVKNKFVIGIWAGVNLTTPSLLPPALNACYAGYSQSDVSDYNNSNTRKYMHAETLALLTKPLYFPNMKYLKLLSW